MPCLEGKTKTLIEKDAQFELETPHIEGTNFELTTEDFGQTNDVPLGKTEADQETDHDYHTKFVTLPLDEYQLIRDGQRR